MTPKKFIGETLRLVTLLSTLAGGSYGYAAEGGGSVYLQASYGDFAAGAGGDPGVYLRDDLAYYAADVGPRTLGGEVAAGADQQSWVNLLKKSWISDFKVLGGTYIASLALPYVFDINLSADLQ